MIQTTYIMMHAQDQLAISLVPRPHPLGLGSASGHETTRARAERAWGPGTSLAGPSSGHATVYIPEGSGLGSRPV